MTVLDASAVLAYLKRERGWEAVEPHLRGAAMSVVNLAEALSKAAETGRDADAVQRGLQDQGVSYFPPSLKHALRVASLQPYARAHDLSYADRFAIALAEDMNADLLTADMELSKTPCGAKIVLIR